MTPAAKTVLPTRYSTQICTCPSMARLSGHVQAPADLLLSFLLWLKISDSVRLVEVQLPIKFPSKHL